MRGREGENRSHQTLPVAEAGGLLTKRGSAQTQTKSCAAQQLELGEGWMGGASVTEHASELTREYAVTALLKPSLKSLPLVLPGFISPLHIIS